MDAFNFQRVRTDFDDNFIRLAHIGRRIADRHGGDDVPLFRDGRRFDHRDIGMAPGARPDLLRQAGQVIILEEDLVLTPDNGNAVICQDDLGNTYDRVGGPFSNYKP